MRPLGEFPAASRWLKSLPAYVTVGEGGAGFAEFAAFLLS